MRYERRRYCNRACQFAHQGLPCKGVRRDQRRNPSAPWPSAKLNDDTVRLIRHLRTVLRLKYREICTHVNASYSAVWNICNGNTWNHVR
jgi:hypothetical protein